jgi:hypothetical protein
VFYSKLCLDAPVFASSRCWTRRRQHADACTTVSDRTGQSRMHRLTYLTWLERRLIELPVPRPAVWEAVQEQLMSYRPALMQPPLARLSARFHAARERVARPVGRVRRRTLGQAVGTLTATPNPIHLEQTGAAVTELTWESANARELEVRLGAPDGHLVSRSGPAGRATTGDWVNNGMRFYLQDVTDGKPLTSLHTLDTVRVSLLP